MGTLLHRLLTGYTFPTYLMAPVGNTLEAITAVVMLNRLGFRRSFGRLKDALVVIAMAVVAPSVSATIGQTAWFMPMDPMTFLSGWFGWWRMNALGILVVFPLAATWAGAPRIHPTRRTAGEIAAITLAMAALGGLLLSIDPGKDQSGMVLSYLALPVALFAALRFGVRGASTAAAAMVVLLSWGTTHGIGPFVATVSLSVPTGFRELALQAVIAIVTMTPMILGAVIAERETALADIAKERERRQDLLAAINRNVNEGLFRITPGVGLAYANTGLARMLGYDSPDDLSRVAPGALIADPARGRELWASILARGEVRSEEVTLVRKDGSTITGLLSCAGVRGADGDIQHYDGAVADISGRKRLEDQLRQAQKLEALGKLAGGVAHDFNNLLTVIGGYAELLRASLPRESSAREEAAEILRAATRAGGLTRQLLAYTRRQVLNPQVIDLREVVEQLSEMLRRLIGENIRLVTRHDVDNAFVCVDRGQIEQVILNLVVNARDAMPDGGTLTVRTAPISPEEVARGTGGQCPPCAQVCLAVQDTGVGMEPDVLARAFDPFFTTKEQGKGTGLGLSTVYGIVRQSGGVIWFESTPGAGTTARVCLPATGAEPTDTTGGTAPSPAAETKGTILVVEDEPAVRDLIAHTLRNAGFLVLAAADGEEALQIAGERATRPDLVVTDVIMPRLGGRALAARLVARWPGLPILYVSGYFSETPDPNDALPPGVDFLQKPFAPSALLERVRRNLGAESAPVG